MSELDKQINWIMEYSTNAVELGELCEQYPGLKNAWDHFQTIYELCRSDNGQH